MRAIFALLMLVAAPAHAQQAASGAGADLRVLDKITGQITDLQLAAGQGAQIGLLDVLLRACRYPSGRIESDAFADLELRYDGRANAIFDGWMVASSPALNSLDHPRYDLWVLRCTN